MSGDRVRAHTAHPVQEELDREANRRVEHLVGAPQERLTARLAELDREWDVERALEVNASLLILIGASVAGVKNRSWWVAPPVVVAAFLLQHGLQGWCPPLSILRRLGFRTQQEIAAERTAVRLLRGDLRAPSDPLPSPRREGSL